VRARFSIPVQTGPEDYPYNGYRVSFQRVRRLECGVDHPPHFVLRFQGEFYLYLYLFITKVLFTDNLTFKILNTF
jgi:hypothetical protein